MWKQVVRTRNFSGHNIKHFFEFLVSSEFGQRLSWTQTHSWCVCCLIAGLHGRWITGVRQPLSHCGRGQSAEAVRLPALSLSPRDTFVQPLVWQLFTLLFRTGLRSPHIHHWHENTGYPCLSTPIWPVWALTAHIYWKTLRITGRTNQMVVSQVLLLGETYYIQVNITLLLHQYALVVLCSLSALH